jgi:type II secretory pathway pseudopilin PulG
MGMSGYTLIEAVVVLGIISLLAAFTLAAWPHLRERQALLIVRQQVQTLFREVQSQAFYEARSTTCLQLFAPDDPDQTRCSDLGLAFRDRKLRIFADTDGNLRYSSSDFVLAEETLAAGVSTPYTDWSSLLFQAVPPNITLFDANSQPVSPDRFTTLTVEIGSSFHNFSVYPYGQIERE